MTMNKPEKTVRISVSDPTGAGTIETHDIAEGTTLKEWMGCYLENNNRKAEGVAIKVNRKDEESEYVLKQGDRISLYFGNLAAAG